MGVIAAARTASVQAKSPPEGGLLLSSFPRRREPSVVRQESRWIPASAGMTHPFPIALAPVARRSRADASLDLGFLVQDVLPGDRIELLHLELAWHRLLVLRRRVEVSGPSRRFQLDLFTHDRIP